MPDQQTTHASGPSGSLQSAAQVLFSYGFRPLFLCSMAAALFFIAWWILLLHGILPAPHTTISIIEWHAHEMLFGFVGAAIGGFLLTAVANWTGRQPVHGVELAVLVALWLCARVVTAWQPDWPPVVIMLLDTGYFLFLTLLVGREVLAAGNNHNRKIVYVLALFVGANFWSRASGDCDVPGIWAPGNPTCRRAGCDVAHDYRWSYCAGFHA